MAEHLADMLLARGKKSFDIVGVSAIGDFWSGSMVATPDLHFALGQTVLKVRSDSTAVVQFKFTLSGSSLIPDQMYQDAMLAMQSSAAGMMVFDQQQQPAATGDDCGQQSARVVELYEDDDEDLFDVMSAASDISPLTTPITFTSLLMEMEELEATSMCELRTNQQALTMAGPMRAIPFQMGGTASMHLGADDRIFFMQIDMENAEISHTSSI